MLLSVTGIEVYNIADHRVSNINHHLSAKNLCELRITLSSMWLASLYGLEIDFLPALP